MGKYSWVKPLAGIVVALVLLLGVFMSFALRKRPAVPPVRTQPPETLEKQKEKPAPQATLISMDELNAALAKDRDAVLLDVRTAEEYIEKHIPRAVLAPLGEPDLEDFEIRVRERVPDTGAAVYVYCRSGRRSAIAAGIMAKMGYENVYDAGGIGDWRFETETGMFD